MVADPTVLPVFALPGVALYPRMALPLHIFEPRYLAMLSDVLDGHGLISMAQVEPEGDVDDEPTWRISTVVGVGRVADYRKNEDGTSDIVLLGESRAKIQEWREGKPYRTASLLTLKDLKPRSMVLRDRLKAELSRHLFTLLARGEGGADRDRIAQVFARESDVGFLADFLAYRFLRDPEDRQVVLEELDVEKRVEHVRDFLSLRGLI